MYLLGSHLWSPQQEVQDAYSFVLCKMTMGWLRSIRRPVSHPHSNAGWDNGCMRGEEKSLVSEMRCCFRRWMSVWLSGVQGSCRVRICVLAAYVLFSNFSSLPLYCVAQDCVDRVLDGLNSMNRRFGSALLHNLIHHQDISVGYASSPSHQQPWLRHSITFLSALQLTPIAPPCWDATRFVGTALHDTLESGTRTMAAFHGLVSIPPDVPSCTLPGLALSCISHFSLFTTIHNTPGLRWLTNWNHFLTIYPVTFLLCF